MAFEFAKKLQADRQAVKAVYAILASTKFPSGKKDICTVEGVIVCRPDRVVVIVEILRRVVIQMHTLRLTVTERNEKTQKVYGYITSDGFRDQSAALGRVSDAFEKIDADEIYVLQQNLGKAWGQWKRRSTQRSGGDRLLRSTQSFRDDPPMLKTGSVGHDERSWHDAPSIAGHSSYVPHDGRPV